jgi:hypothetical protein
MNIKALAAVACLWAPMAAVAADDGITSKIDSLNQKFEKILSSQGISMGGQVTGAYGASILGGNGEQSSRRDDEGIGFTQVDFDLRARPSTLTEARAVFRMYLDDASFWGSPYTPFETRWLSIDGKTQDGIFYYHLGNLSERWSALTLSSDVPSLLYTPRIFAQQQRTAQEERFVVDGYRNLQGFNTGIRAAVPNLAIDSFDVQLLAAKLLTGAGYGQAASAYTSKFNISLDGTTGYPDSLANFDRWAYGARGTVTFLGAFNLGFNFLGTQDLKSTFGVTDTAKRILRTTVDSYSVTGKHSAWSKTAYSGTSPEIARDSLAQNGKVLSFQVGGDIAKFIGNKNLILSLDGEVGSSSWDYFAGRSLSSVLGTGKKYTVNKATNDTTLVTTADSGYFAPTYKTKTGNAIDIAVKAGWKTDAFSVSAMGGYIQNDSAFRSDLAQTPVFYSPLGRIYNSEQDVNGQVHYNVFDALYDNVHRWVAEEKNEYSKNPYDKLAYTNYVAGWAIYPLGQWTSEIGELTTAYLAAAVGTDTAATKAAKLALYNGALADLPFDRDLQFVLPGGEASSNRVGPKFGFNGSFLNGGVEAVVKGYMLEEATGTVLDSLTQASPEKAKFQQIQVGAKVRVDRFFPNWNTLLHPKSPIPLEISASVGQVTAKGGTWLDYQSNQLAASLYVGVLPRLALLGGYETIQGTDNTAAGVSRNETDIAGGLEFKVQEGAYFLATVSQLKTEYPNAPEYDFDQTIWNTKISISF